MIFKDLTAELTYKMVQDFAQANRAQQLAYYERRYRELEGTVFDSAEDVARIWPRRYRESSAAYNERVKIWPQIPRIVCNRLASILLKGKTERKWVALADADQAVADQANELQERMDEANDWDSQAAHIYFYALGIGEIALWPEFRRFDKFTGKPYVVGKGQGVPIWSHFFPWFVEPISLQDYAQETVGAVKLTQFDNMLATPLVSAQFGVGVPQDIVEVWASPRYDRMTGAAISKGFYRKWLNDRPAAPPSNEKGGDDPRWWNENLYGCNPVVFFCSGDPDETGYRGKSFLDRFDRLVTEHAAVISDIGQSIALIPYIWRYSGEQTIIDKLVIRRNAIAQVPVGGVFEKAGGDLNLTEDWNQKKELEHLISLAAVLPMEVWDMLPAGKVESGVALKLLFQPLQESIQQTRRHTGKAEKQRMRNAAMMFNTHNPGSVIDLEKIRPEVNYDEQIIPVDDAVEIVNDLALLGGDLRDRVALVRKYNPQFTTDLQAEEFIQKQQAEKQAAAPPVRLFGSLARSTAPTPPEPQPAMNGK